jgi:hypothetical protein
LKKNDRHDDCCAASHHQFQQQRDLATLWAKQALGRLTKFNHDELSIADPVPTGCEFESFVSISEPSNLKHTAHQILEIIAEIREYAVG